MSAFPRTKIDKLSVSRMVIGTNWLLGYSHTSRAKDDWIKKHLSAKAIADVFEVFLRAGVDTVMGPMRPAVAREPEHGRLYKAMQMAQDRVGRKLILIATPSIFIHNRPGDDDRNAEVFDRMAGLGAAVCMPHTSCTDALVDVRQRRIADMDRYCRMIRDRGMIPGLSTHMPEAITYADETGLDVATYIGIYNAAGFLMHIEVDWMQRVIRQAKRPVLTIKPLAAGRLMPLVGLAFVWSTLRPIDMVTIGTMTADEAREVVDISLSVLSGVASTVQLQRTRSKESVERKK